MFKSTENEIINYDFVLSCILCNSRKCNHIVIVVSGSPQSCTVHNMHSCMRQTWAKDQPANVFRTWKLIWVLR